MEKYTFGLTKLNQGNYYNSIQAMLQQAIATAWTAVEDITRPERRLAIGKIIMKTLIRQVSVEWTE